MDTSVVDTVLLQEQTSNSNGNGIAAGEFSLEAGDMVVLTGEISRPRDEWAASAVDCGLVVHPAVTKKVKLVVTADPDSLSGKARKARQYDIPVVTEEAFERMLGQFAG
jgi:DNA polymerase-3 subunit epsilon